MIILGIIIVSLLVGLFWYIKEANKQIVNLTRAVIARSLHEFDSKPETKEIIKDETSAPEFTPIEDVDQETFNKIIEKQLNG